MSTKKLIQIFSTLVVLILLPSTALAINTSLPSFNNPFDDLQVKIPGMARFSDVSLSQNNGSVNLQVNWIGEYIMGLYNYAISIIGIFAVVGIAIGGVIWLMSVGNPSRVAMGKDWIVSSILGLLLALGSYFILNTINPDLVKMKGVNIAYVEETPGTLASGGGQFLGSTGTGATFNNNVDSYDDLIKQAAQKYSVDATLIKAIMMAESGGNPNAASSAGAKGLMQLMPATADSIGVSGNLFDPQTSIEGGVKYISILKNTACNGSTSNSVCNVSQIKNIIAAYNGGPKANKESTRCPGQTQWECSLNHNGPTTYEQTFDYVARVQANYQKLKDNGWNL